MWPVDITESLLLKTVTVFILMRKRAYSNNILRCDDSTGTEMDIVTEPQYGWRWNGMDPGFGRQ
jgi:hypothetical protein